MSQILATTQEHLDIEDIRDDFVVLKDGSVLAVLLTTAVNFDLLSEREQDAMIEAYGGFLNSLSFPIQIVIRSKRLDISSYLALLKKEEEKQGDPALKEHIKGYHDFVKNLIVRNQVLDKNFYVVIAQREVSLSFENPLLKLWRGFRGSAGWRTAPAPRVDPAKLVEAAQPKLDPKAEHVTKQLARIGIQTKKLHTKQLVRLFNEIYNYE